MSDLTNDMAGSAGEPQYLYSADQNLFWKLVGNEWIALREPQLRRDLMKRGLKHKMVNGTETISQLDNELRKIEQEQRVRTAMEVAGWHQGVQQMGADRVLVPRSAPLVAPVEGEALLTQAFYEGLFRGWDDRFVGQDTDQTSEVEVDQRQHVFTFLQHWLESLYTGRPTKGIAIHLAGVRESGKTRFSEHCREMTGGRVGRPYRYMIGRENFNRSGIEASLQLVDDDQADTSREARKEFGAQMKKFTANEEVEARAMHKDGFNLKPTWRLMVLTNMQEQALQVMPQITEDLRDKVLQLKGYVRDRLPAVGDEAGWKAYRERYPALSAWWDHALAKGILKPEDLPHCWPMPMPTGMPRQQMAFWERIRAELPAFVHWIKEQYTPPAQVVGGRFGVRHWQHPEIMDALNRFASYVRLYQLIERSRVVWRKEVPVDVDGAGSATEWQDVDHWEGTATQLETLLKSDASALSRHEKEKEVPVASYVGQRLTEAMEAWGRDVVDQLPRTRKGGRAWRIKRVQELLA